MKLEKIKYLLFSTLVPISLFAITDSGNMRAKIISADGITFAYSEDIYSNGYEGIKRHYPKNSTLTPLLGYTHRDDKKNQHGVKGLEKSLNDTLNSAEDVWLSISYDLQGKMELLADSAKKKYDAKEILIAVMNSDDGKSLSLASSNRYNPEIIKSKDFSSLNISATNYLFEPGFVMIPIILSQLLDTNKVQADEVIDAYSGHYEFENKILKDAKQFNWMEANESITNKSSIVISQLAQRFNGDEYYEALNEFGLLSKSGLEIEEEKVGRSKSALQLNSAIYKTITSYGKGINTNMVQLLRAYNVFNNNGVLLQASLLNGSKSEKFQIISSKISKVISDALSKNLQNRSDITDIFELELGGMYSSTRVVKEGKYSNNYVSSFFGYVNDISHKYTIGIVVIEPKKGESTSVAIFDEVIENLSLKKSKRELQEEHK